jgi:hypothetical protein
LRLHGERIRVGFSYKDSPNLAKQVLKATALETQGILSNPTPQIFTISYDDFAITYEVKFFIEDYGELEDIRDRFVTRIWYAAQRNNLNIPFPIRTLYHFHGPTSLNQGTEKKFAESLQAMSAPLPLDSTEITLQHFGYGEKVINQNSLNNSLYVLISGEAMIKTLDSQGKEQEVMILRRGEFFGEMSLFSHEPSPVSVISITDLEVMKILLAKVIFAYFNHNTAVS